MTMSRQYTITSTAYNKRGVKICSDDNSYHKTHPMQKSLSLKLGLSEYRAFLHSELRCILRAASLGQKIDTLKVERYGHNGKPRLAFPCESCQLAIKEAGIKVVVFTTEEGFKKWIV